MQEASWGWNSEVRCFWSLCSVHFQREKAGKWFWCFTFHFLLFFLHSWLIDIIEELKFPWLWSDSIMVSEGKPSSRRGNSMGLSCYLCASKQASDSIISSRMWNCCHICTILLTRWKKCFFSITFYCRKEKKATCLIWFGI